jgi:hypothetical protein
MLDHSINQRSTPSACDAAGLDRSPMPVDSPGRGRGLPLNSFEARLAASGPCVEEHEIEQEANARRGPVWGWLGRLDKRERWSLVYRYELDGNPKQNLVRLGQQFAITRQRIREIVARAQAKIRKFARRERLDISEISGL